MQDRYTGDLGDFGKFGLLRRLCRADEAGGGLRLGIVWYLVPDESRGQDGKHVKYLQDIKKNRRRFERCDPELWTALKYLVDSNNREIGKIQQTNILPEETVFYDQPLYWPEDMKANSKKGREKRLDRRREWWQDAFDLTENCDLVFFDPDNGLNSKTKKYASKGPKFAFADEVAPFFHRGQSLVIYQHVGRTEKAENQARRRLRQLQEETKCERPFALYYKRGTARLFLVVPVRKYARLLDNRGKQMCSGAWGQHFTKTINP